MGELPRVAGAEKCSAMAWSDAIALTAVGAEGSIAALDAV